MKENKNKKESRLCDLIFHNRHCLAFITVLVFLLTYGLSVSAAQTGSYITTNLISYYSIQGTSIPLGSDVVLQRASLDGFDTTKITAQPSGIYSNDLPSYMNGTSGSKFYIVDSIADDSTQVTYDFSSSQFHVFYKSATSSNTFSYACIGNGNFALLGIGSNNFAIVSDAPFTFGRYQDWGSGGAYWANNVSTPLANGLYVQSETYMQIGFTDMPYYLPTSDSSSGWSSYSTSSTDFSFSNTNYDFNYALTGEEFVNPNAPVPEVESDAKYHLTFRDNTYYSGNGLNQFWHNNNFTFTEFQINNPVYYRLKFSYRVEFANNLGVDDVYYYTPSDDVQLAYFLGQSNRLGTGSRIAVPLSSDWFKNGSNHSLTSAIISTINAVTGTDVQYVNPNGLFENIIDWAVTVDNYVFGDGSGSPLQVVTNRYDGVITKFKIYGEVSLYNEVNSNYESYSYKDSHNFLTGNGQVISTDNTVAPYEDSPTPVYEELPSCGSNGGVSAGAGSAVATIQKGAIQIYTGASGQNGFQLSAQGWTDYGTFYQAAGNSLLELMSGTGEFPEMVKEAGSCLPAPLWTLILAGAATSICIGLWHGVRNH